jgi:hypothetical protein
MGSQPEMLEIDGWLKPYITSTCVQGIGHLHEMP